MTEDEIFLTDFIWDVAALTCLVLFLAWLAYELWTRRCRVLGHREHPVRIGRENYWQCDRCLRISD